ncbi:hypothetical protein IC614_05915 [Allosphingosinicella flava]|uniref:Uncharacterized protein n=1 Tax=Allosphingosinicella flava TaxID=2771430 RepID=A0A7T2GLR2_9SPHN|nr:hypothetical protein [Sphingosinicella flava]QPQ56102.1 hypothetical protein IC614_05915 [Sphingosinicella flava]
MIRILVGLSLTLVPLDAAMAAELVPVDGDMSARELCDNLLQVSLRKAAKEKPLVDAGPLHAGLQRGLPEPPADALTIRVLIGGGIGSHGPAGLESVVAWRDANGRWEARRAEERRRGMPPEPERPLAPVWPDPNPKPLIEGHIPQPSSLEISAGPLPQQAVQSIERALLPSSCIQLEPPRMPVDLPLKGGGRLPCVPDSASWHIEIRQGGNVQRYERPCRLVGPAGLIAQTLDYVALPAAPIVRSRKDLYNGVEYPSAESLRLFLSDRLPGILYRDAQGEGRIRSIRHVQACAAVMQVEGADGGIREIGIDWRKPRGFPQWISDGVVELDGEGDAVGSAWIAPGTTLALQLQGALWSLFYNCPDPK